MYWLVEDWKQTEMDVMYLRPGITPNENRWRVLGRYQTAQEAWNAYQAMVACDDILKPSDRFMRAL